MNGTHRSFKRLFLILIGARDTGVQILSLFFVMVIVCYASAQQTNQRPRSERHLAPSDFPWPNGAKMALSLSSRN